MKRYWIAPLGLLATGAPAQDADKATLAPPAAMTVDGAPRVPLALATQSRPYLETRNAGFAGWNPQTHAALILTRFGNVAQVHEVSTPLGMRRQLSFEADRISGASYAKKRGDVLMIQKDVGGNENWQLYTLKDGRLGLLTDGKSRNDLNTWSQDGRWIAYTSTRRNGADNDIYVMDPRDPTSDRLIAQVKGGGWGVQSFAPDGRRALVAEYVSVNKTNLFLMDVKSGRITPLGNPAAQVSYGGGEFAPDGSLWVTSDEGSDFKRLGTIDPASGRFTAVAPEPKWDVDEFDVSDDGRTVAYVVNEAGVSRLKLMDVATRQVRTVPLPAGGIGSIQFAPWGTLGFTLTSAKSPADTYALDPASLRVTRWTQSETGGLDPSVNVEPEFVEVKSFDGEPVSGFLYRPDPKKFPGRRPLLFDIHGGPEGQATPGFLGTDNYLINELGITMFYPNVRGSSGFGKRFVALDNGPFKREDSVKDIGAFLDHFARDRRIDPKRIAETGGSYGGYMCYAVAIRYGDRLKAADCIVAISNFVTFLQNTASYRRDLRRVEYGDERNPAQRAKLLEISPLTRAKDLKIPLLVVTGGNDPRVPASEAAQMVAAVRANGAPAWAMLAADEGHGYAKKENRDYQFWTELMFWRRNLLGEQGK